METPIETPSAPRRRRSRIWIVVSILCTAIFGTGLSIWFDWRKPECNPLLPDLDICPMQFRTWNGTRQNLNPTLFGTTQADELIVRNYKNQKGKSITAVIAYYSDVEAGLFHNPLKLYTASGYKLLTDNLQWLTLNDGSTLHVRILSCQFMNNTETRVRAIFWYQLGGHVLYEKSDLNALHMEKPADRSTLRLAKVHLQILEIDGDDSESELKNLASDIASWLNGVKNIR